MKLPTREQLEKRRAIVIADAQMKLECGDWHGCADACMDLREIDAKIALLDELRENARLIAEPVGDTGFCGEGAMTGEEAARGIQRAAVRGWLSTVCPERTACR